MALYHFQDNLPTPQVTICPVQPNLNNLFYNFLNENPNLVSEAALVELETMIKVTMYENMVDECVDSIRNFHPSDITLYDHCEEIFDQTEECHLIHVIAAIARAQSMTNSYLCGRCKQSQLKAFSP